MRADRGGRDVVVGVILGDLWAVRAGDTPLEDVLRLFIASVLVTVLAFAGRTPRIRHGDNPYFSVGFIVRVTLAHITLALSAALAVGLLELALAHRTADDVVAAGLFVVAATIGPRVHCWLVAGRSEAEASE